jgi:hypothetical protein
LAVLAGNGFPLTTIGALFSIRGPDLAKMSGIDGGDFDPGNLDAELNLESYASAWCSKNRREQMMHTARLR